MTTDELIKALKWVARVTTYCDTHMVNCHECEFHGFCTDPNSDESIGQQSEWFTQAADELTRLAKENAELRDKIKRIHDALNFADRQRSNSTNYTELAINNGLALGRIAVLIKHDYDDLPEPPQKGC